MRLEKYPYTYSIEGYKPRRFEYVGELEALFSAERDDKYYLIWDSHGIAEFWLEEAPERYTPDDFQESIRIWEFDTQEERAIYMQEHYGPVISEESFGRRAAYRFNENLGYTE